MTQVVFVYFGVIRNVGTSWPRLQSHVVEPISAQAGRSISAAHLYRLNRMRTGRRNEPGGTPFREFESLGIDHLAVTEAEVIPTLFQDRRFEVAKLAGDAYLDDFQSLRNLFLQLRSLQIATEAAINTGADVFVFVRPDLYYWTRLRLNSHLIGQNIVEIPFFQWFGGLNDRFAIAYSLEAARAYGGRIANLIDYVETARRPVQAEQFLLFSLLKNASRFYPKFSYASRVRTDGQRVRENFLPIRSMRFRNMLRRKREWSDLYQRG